MQSSNLCFIAKIVQCEDFLLILHKDNLQRAMNNNAVIIPQTKKKKKSPTLQVQEWLDLIYASSNDWSKDITCPMHTANDSPPAPTDTLLGWKSIFTTSEALETNKEVIYVRRGRRTTTLFLLWTIEL